MREVLVDWGAEELAEAAILLTSELVTNAVLHARSGPEVTVRLLDGRLWIGVADGTPQSPARKRYGAEAATGRGLLLVERMATAWGFEGSDRGKVVWFELDEGSTDPGPQLDAEALADLAQLGVEGGPAGDRGAHRRGLRGPRVRTWRAHPPSFRRTAGR